MAPLTELFGFPPSGTISPSIRMLEKDFSAYNPGISFSKTALIGFSSKGPINEPTQVFNHEDLYRKFGHPDPTVDHGSYLIYAGMEFLKFGSEAWILRVGEVDETDWSNFAKTAYVEVPASGIASVIRTQLVGSTTINIVENVNDKFRFSTNGSTYQRLITIPAGEYTLVSTVGTDNNLVDTFNGLLVTDDGIEAYEEESTLAFRTTERFGSTASIELISVEDSIYSAIEIGKTMDLARVTGANDRWPIASSTLGFDFSGLVNPTLKVRVNGTSDIAIDNIIQNIPFDDLITTYNAATHTNTLGIGGPVVAAEDIADYINWWIDNPTLHTETVTGGFRASNEAGAIKLFTAKRYVDSLGSPLTSDGLTSGQVNPDFDGINYIDGANALVQVRFYSNQVDTILGFSNDAVTGTIETAVSTVGFIDGDPTTISGTPRYIDDVGKTTGSTFTAATAPILMTIWAESPGLAGNDTQVTVAIDEDGLTTLVVYNDGINVESHGTLNYDAATANNPFYIEQWINGFSDYLFIEHNDSISGHPAEATYQLGATTVTQGSDGYPYTSGIPDASRIDALVLGDAQQTTGMNSLAEPEKIDIDIVCAPALNSTAVMSALMELCGQTRRDCMSILDAPFGLESIDVRKWHNGAHPLNDTRLDSSYAALYWPWVEIRDPFNSIDVWVPPTGSVCGVYANSERAESVWAAPAGLRRGLMPTVKNVETYAYLQERDALYGNRNAVNVIVPFPIDGPTVWGQKTLQRKATSLDRVNVRRLMLFMEKTIRFRSRYLLFEAHDEILRSEFVRMASAVLDEIKSGRGVHDYIIKCDEELNPPEVIDRNEMRARIGVQPTKVAEFIFIEFTIHKTGTFDESVI